MSIRPLFASQKLLPGPPYMGCGLSSDWFATMLASDNEQGQNQYHRQKGQGGRRSTLKRGWKAFENQVPADSNGWVDQGDIQLIHRAMFGKDIPQPFIGRIPLNEVWDAIGDYAVSAAIDTGVVGAGDAIRRYVGAVPHQVVWWKKKTTNGVRWVKHMCPMHKPSDGYTGHWVKWDSAKKCARAIKGSQGEALVVLYPIGDWTQAKLLNADLRNTVRGLRSSLAAADKTIDNKQERINSLVIDKAALKAANEALEDQLTECRNDCGDAGREALLDDLEDWIKERRA